MVPRSNVPTIATYLKGALFGLTAVSIWAGWSALTRLAVTTKFDAWDIAALRFAIAGCLLAPIAVHKGLALDRLGWSGLALLIAGAGVPYVLLAAAGLQFAPAHDQGALNPGVMPLFVALITALGLGEKLATAKQLYLPIYLAFFGTHLAQIPRADVVLQAIFQGLLVTVISLVLYGRAVALLGASGGAAFGALVPALSALFAIPLLGEWPNRSDWIGIGLISGGVYLASGGPIGARSYPAAQVDPSRDESPAKCSSQATERLIGRVRASKK